jgi:hypothetical protein
VCSTLVLLKASATSSMMRAFLVLALALASANVIAAQVPRHLPSLMLSHQLPPRSDTSAKALAADTEYGIYANAIVPVVDWRWCVDAPTYRNGQQVSHCCFRLLHVS